MSHATAPSEDSLFSRGCTVSEALRRMTSAFGDTGIDTPGLDARWLLAGVLGIERAAPLLEPERPLTAADLRALDAACRRRLAREPISRILGRREFHGLDLVVTPATLDPRPDTETLVDGVIALVQGGHCSGGACPLLVDLGTGTGAILIALLKALPEAQGVAVDIDPAALEVARRNAHMHGVDRRMRLHCGSWLEGLAQRFDVVVSNPPYIPTGAIFDLAPDVREHDPMRALDGGVDGLDAYRAIIPQAVRALRPGGWLALEIGSGQEAALAPLINQSFGMPVADSRRSWRDLGGHVRCVAAQAQVSEQSKKALGMGPQSS